MSNQSYLPVDIRHIRRGGLEAQELRRYYEQGKKDRKAGRSFASHTYADPAKAMAWEAGWRSVK